MADLRATLDRVLAGDRPAADPVDVASQYDWDRVTEQALAVYRAAIGVEQPPIEISR